MFNGHPFFKTKGAMEVDGSDGCTALRIYLIPQHRTLKMVKMVKFMSCVFYY